MIGVGQWVRGHRFGCLSQQKSVWNVESWWLYLVWFNMTEYVWMAGSFGEKSRFCLHFDCFVLHYVHIWISKYNMVDVWYIGWILHEMRWIGNVSLGWCLLEWPGGMSQTTWVKFPYIWSPNIDICTPENSQQYWILLTFLFFIFTTQKKHHAGPPIHLSRYTTWFNHIPPHYLHKNSQTYQLFTNIIDTFQHTQHYNHGCWTHSQLPIISWSLVLTHVDDGIILYLHYSISIPYTHILYHFCWLMRTVASSCKYAILLCKTIPRWSFLQKLLISTRTTPFYRGDIFETFRIESSLVFNNRLCTTITCTTTIITNNMEQHAPHPQFYPPCCEPE